MTEFSFLPLRVNGQCNTQTVDCGLQTGGNIQGGLPHKKDGVLAITN